MVQDGLMTLVRHFHIRVPGPFLYFLYTHSFTYECHIVEYTPGRFHCRHADAQETDSINLTKQKTIQRTAITKEITQIEQCNL